MYIQMEKKGEICSGFSVQSPESLLQSCQADKGTTQNSSHSVPLKYLVAVMNTGQGNQEEKGEGDDI